MKTKNLLKPIKFGILVSALMLISTVAFSTSFSAVLSGNWSNTATWGGTVPSLTNTADQITIPVGITVTMDNSVTLNGLTAQITVLGTLSYSGSNTLDVSTGIVSGSGTINADAIMLGGGASLISTGSVTANTMTSSTLSLETAAWLMVNQTLTLTSGMLSLQTGGTLGIAANGTIMMSGGQLGLSGGLLDLTSNYNVTYTTSSATAGLELSGSGLHNVTVNVGAANNVTLSSDLTVNGTLTLTTGTLMLASNNLTIAGDVAASGTGTISSTAASNINITSSTGITGTLMFSGSSSVNNLMVNIGSTSNATISGTLNVTGTLTLTSGMLMLNAANLTIAGNIANSGSGTIASTSTSNINISTTSSPSGSLGFSVGNNTVNNFTVNIGGNGSVMISSNLNVNGTLNLTTGYIDIGNNMLTVTNSGMISGGSSTSYVITGTTGALVMSVTAGASSSSMFPIGTSTMFFPASIMLNTGSSSGNVQVGVSPHVYADGTSGTDLSTTQHVVDATWNVHSDIVSNLNLNLQVMWAAAAELNGFMRTSAYVSHYTSASWDMSALASASSESGGMYALTRANLTSLSPFAVFDQSTVTGVNELTNNTNVEIYPNPSSDNVNINFTGIMTGETYLDIVNVLGQIVGNYRLTNPTNTIAVSYLPDGEYFLKLYDNNNMNTVKRFTKVSQ